MALVLVYPTFTIPFCTWLMAAFFRAVPLEIEERGSTAAAWRAAFSVSSCRRACTGPAGTS